MSPSRRIIRVRYSAGSLSECRVTDLAANRHTRELYLISTVLICRTKFDRPCPVLFTTRLVIISGEMECERFDLLPITEASVSLQTTADVIMHLQQPYYCRPTAITARRVLTLRHIPRYPRENSRLMINRKCMTYIVNPRRLLKKTKYTHTHTHTNTAYRIALS